MAYEWEVEEWRCAVQAATDAGELDDWRPTRAELDAEEALWEWEAHGPLEGYDDE